MTPVIVVKSSESSAPPTEDEISSILTAIFTSKTSQASLDASYSLTTVLQNSIGFRGFKGYGILDEIKKAAADKKNPVRREGSMFALGALFERFPRHQRLSEVIFLLQEEHLVPLALDALSDKVSTIRDSAQYALDALFDNLEPEAKVAGLLPVLVKYLGRKSGKWQGTVGAFELLGRMADKAKMGIGSAVEEKDKDILRDSMGRKLEGLIPVVEGGMHDLKAEVSRLNSTGFTKDTNSKYTGCETSSENYGLSHNSPPK